MEFGVRKSRGDKCSLPACGKAITVDEPVFLTTSLAFGERGSTLGFHPKCVQPDQVSSAVADWDQVHDWKKFPESLKEEVKTAFAEVLKNKGKKVATPIKRKAESKTDTSKATKTSKSLTPAKAKEKADKAEQAASSKKGGPKKALSAYMFFANGERQTIVDANPTAAPKDIMKLLGAAWGTADADTKKKYGDEAENDKERYAKQKKEFDETGQFTKTPEEIEADKTRAEKAVAAKEKAKQKKHEKKPEAAEQKTDKTEKPEAEERGAEEDETTAAKEEAEEEVENVEEEATKEDEVEDADAVEDAE